MGEFRTVIIVTYGRSGGTLLMGLLNAIPGYAIRGENCNCFYQLHRFFSALSDPGNYSASDPTSPWFNCFELPLVYDAARQLFRNVLDPRHEARVLGFKEIRWCEIGDPDELFAYLDFLRRLTNCVYVFHTRDLDYVTSSETWMEDKRAVLETFEDNMQEYQRINPSAVYHTTYEDIVYQGKVLRGLFEFLGESYPADIARVLQTKYGWGSFPRIRMGVRRPSPSARRA